MKILIADDSAMQRQLLERHVLAWGYDPVIAKDGSQAWDLLKRGDAPRLAILDWQMPGIDGIEVCRRAKLRQDLAFTYIVMLTSRDAEEDIVAGLDAGADDYLIKPVEPKILRSRLAAARRIVELVPPKEWSSPRVPGYEVKQLLGRGACASVWQALHQDSQRVVALKIMRVDLVTSEVFDRFAREIRIMQKLNHPTIARVYDSRIEKNLAYFTMELIDGVTFDRFVKEKKPKAGKVLALAAEISDALHYAHEQGVIHRDLKPSNIIITPTGEPKIVDFGLARSMFLPDEQYETSESLEGTVIGTPLFMAPEQARGENESLDGRADIYALGIIIYMVLVRRHPHQVNRHDRWQTIRAIAEGSALRPSEVRPRFNRELERILMTALAEDPADRYPTAAAFSKDIRRFLIDLLAEHRRQKPTHPE